MLAASSSIACGWSPVGAYASVVLKEAIGTRVSSVSALTQDAARPTESPPYGAYAAIMGTFCGGLAFAGGVARLLGRDPREHNLLDFVVLCAASYKAARTIARDEVTSFVRAPF